MQIVDLSVPLANDVPADPAFQRVAIDYVDHEQGAKELAAAFPGLEPSQLPDGKGWALERARISTHNGTHMDAPWHYHPTMDGGAPALTIDQIPLDWCMRPGVRLDFRHLPDGYLVTPADLDDELERIEHVLEPLEIVVCATRAGSRYGHDDYIRSGCGFGRDATLHLIERGIKIVGTDGWSWDAPFDTTLARFQRDHDPSIIWEGHKAGRDRGYCQLEKLHRLEDLPDCGFTIVCFPIAIKAASAGWTRAVALIEDGDE